MLKPVPTGKKGKGLSKLPKKVRNKMGFMKDGGRVMKAGGGAVGFQEKTISQGKMPKKQERAQIAGFGKARR